MPDFDDEAPDLQFELDHGPAAPPAAAPAPVPVSAPAVGISLASPPMGGVVAPVAAAPPPVPAVALSLAAPPAAGVTPGAPLAPAPAIPVPVPVPFSPSSLAGTGFAGPEIDPIDVLALADYGATPKGWAETPLYVLRVRQRRAALRQGLHRQRKLLEEATAASQADLARVIDAFRRGAQPTHPAMGLVEALRPFDEAAAGRLGALEQTSQRRTEELAALDGRAAALEGERVQAEAVLAEAQASLEHQAAEHARGDAKVKRVDIELRAAHEAARLAAGRGAKYAPPEHARRIADLDAERALRVVELDPVANAYADAQEVVRERRAVVRELRAKMAGLQEERRRIEQAASRQIDLRSQGAQEAERARIAAYAGGARELLRAYAHDVPGELRDGVSRSDSHLRAVTIEVERHVRALSAADPVAMRRGHIVIGVAAGLLILLVAMVVRTAAI